MKKLRPSLSILCMMVIACSLMFLLATMGYCFLNTSGHGPDPVEWSVWYAPVVILGCLVLIFGLTRSGMLAIVVGLIGMLFSHAAKKWNIMHDYEDWIRLGMPESNPYRSYIILGFAGVICTSLITTVFLTKNSRRIRRWWQRS